MECFPEMEGDLTFYIRSLRSKIELFIPNLVHITGRLSQRAMRRREWALSSKRGSLKAELSALCGSLTFLLLQMTKF